MVQNHGLLAIAHLETFHRHLIEGRFGLIFVLIAHDIDVPLQEPLLGLLRVDHRAALVAHGWIQFVRSQVTRVANLEIRRLKVTLHTAIGDPLLRIGCAIVSLSSRFIDPLLHFIETRQSYRELRVRCMVLLTCGDIRESVFHNCKHLAYSEENPTREQVLVIYHEPSVQNVDDFRLQDLRAGQFCELLLFQHLEVLLRSRFFTERLAVCASRGQLPENLFDVRALFNLHGKVIWAELVFVATDNFFEALLALHVNDSLDNIETLGNRRKDRN